MAPIEDRFKDASLVFHGRVEAVDIPGIQQRFQNGIAAPLDYAIKVGVEKFYKGSSQQSSLSILLPQKSSVPISVGTDALFFVNSAQNSLYTLAQSSGCLLNLRTISLPITSLGFGAGGLQDDFVGAAIGKNPPVLSSILEFLLGFSTLSESAQRLALALSQSSDFTLRLRSVELLSKAAPSRWLPRLAETLGTSPQASLPEQEILDDIVANRTSSADLEVLKKFATFPNESLRLNAMLGIRRIKASLSVPFLIEQLKASDLMVQYEAVITLAEITGRSGEFGPGLGLFDREPKRYTVPWERWWAGTDSEPYRTAQNH